VRERPRRQSQGGTLTIETPAVRLDAEDAARHPRLNAGTYAVLTVRDTGTGIAPGDRERVFEVVEPLRHPPALFMSGFAGDAPVRQGLLGAGRAKPFTAQSLLAAVRASWPPRPNGRPRHAERDAAGPATRVALGWKSLEYAPVVS
jgi:hypothetical protein